MEDNNIFQDFVNNALGVATIQVCNAIFTFAKKCISLLAVTGKDIELFVKEINSSIRARTPDRNILITPNLPQYFKSVPFELKDRQIYGALTNSLVMQEIGVSQLHVMCRARN